MLHLLDLCRGHPGDLLLHRLRLLRKRRAEFRARRLRGGRLLGAGVGEVLPQIALEIGIGGRKHLELRAQFRGFSRRRIARACQRSHPREHGDDQGSDDDKRNENEQEQRVRHGEASLLRGANAGRVRLRRFPACLGRVGVD